MTASKMFSLHGWLHVIMIAVIAFLTHHYIDVQQFGDATSTSGMEAPCDHGDIPHTLAPEKGADHPHNNRRDPNDDITLLTTDHERSSTVNDESELSSIDLLSKASTFFVDTTMGTLMQMTQAQFVDGVSEEYDPGLSSESRIIMEEGSSVWCSGDKHTNRICRFHNLCYFPEEDDFVFFHGDQSVISGVPADRFSPTLLDMSSVLDHNQQYFNYIDLKASEASNFNIEFIKTQSLIYRRFNPDNLMHAFHDDLLPQYRTLQMMSGNSNMANYSAFDIQLVFMEGWSPGDYAKMYQLFSNHKP
jgi:hypothetical protein